ncbi:unnamed protein product (macronuclear) [Paramecium tetraurelia]|uniref:Uncharacterized protein n=1 Tax=Paramecium tetraurelia TaxID=5888 RepID=A0CE58_PARTE|nr:uncharacterized protein GSPATT00037511001 [Paramecium tetraurelia]CAK69075.1 unnamed protein product [Paramecium tetraurelia]|eukprot:XP_001436472.1 hypothetical protein (macronuclear) [Paramecium tetraurelia strain d4-2]
MIKKEVRLLLLSAKKFIDQLPQQKQQRASINLMKIVQEAKPEEQIIKEIQYQINFLKLTNPNIQYQQITQEEESIQEKIIQKFNEQQEQQQKTEDIDLKKGTYIYQNGNLVQGQAEKRKEVDYSNWYAANVDPDDLKKHKELLDRQHFSGPFWEGKPMPKSILDEENPNTLMYSDERPEKELNPNLKQERSGKFEKVKR